MSDDALPSAAAPPRARRGFFVALGGVIAAVALFFVANQLFGGGVGAPCGDSYACRGLFLGRGVECLQEGAAAYCTRTCHTSADCPAGWTCEGANPTVLTVATTVVAPICARPR